MSAHTDPLGDVIDNSLDVHEAAFRWGDADPSDLVAAGVKHIGRDPSRAVVEEDSDGNTVFRSVDDFIPDHRGFPVAVRRFRNEANNVGDGVNKRDVIAYATFKFLSAEGEFFKTLHGTLYYFYDAEKRVYRVDGDGGADTTDEFRSLVAEVGGVSAGRSGRALLTTIMDLARRDAPERETHRFAAWDEDAETLYITDFNDGYYAIDGDSIERRDNGDEVFFLEMDGQPYEYLDPADRATFSDPVPGELHKWHKSGDLLMRFFGNRINYDPAAILTPEQQRTQMYVHLHAMAFLDYFTAKPITAFVGEKGSGKTVIQRSVGKFLFGGDWTESMMPSEREDFAAIVNNRPLAFVDNFDQAVDWSNDILASVATGSADIRRELYTTMDMAKMNPDCFIAITSRDPPFRRDDVADRTVVFRVTRLDNFIGMRGFLNPVVRNRDSLWSDYLDNLNEIVATMRNTDLESMVSTHRMSDWAAFAKVCGDVLEPDNVDETLEVMQKERALFALEDDSLFRAIREWLTDEGDNVRGVKWKASGLLTELQEYAEDNDIEFTYNRAQTLGKRLTNVAEEMDELFGFDIDDSGRDRTYCFIDPSEDPGRQGMLGYGKFAPGEDDGDGDDDDDGSGATTDGDSDDGNGGGAADRPVSSEDGGESENKPDPDRHGEKSQKDVYDAVKDSVRSGEDDFDDGVPRDALHTLLTGKGYQKGKVDHAINKLQERGEIYTPQAENKFKTT